MRSPAIDSSDRPTFAAVGQLDVLRPFQVVAFILLSEGDDNLTWHDEVRFRGWEPHRQANHLTHEVWKLIVKQNHLMHGVRNLIVKQNHFTHEPPNLIVKQNHLMHELLSSIVKQNNCIHGANRSIN